MIQIYSEVRGKEGFYPVYENADEFNAAGLTYVDNFDDLKEGEYFLTRNGYYIPLVAKHEYRDGKLTRFTFPRAKFTVARRKTGIYYTPKIVYEPRHKTRDKIKDGDVALFIQLVFSGLTPTRAWGLITATRKQSAIHNINSYFALLTSESLHKQLKEIMKSDLKQGFVANKMDATWYAKTLKDLIEGDKTHKDVKLKALDEIKTILDADAEPVNQSAQDKMKELRKDVLKKYETTTGPDG